MVVAAVEEGGRSPERVIDSGRAASRGGRQGGERPGADDRRGPVQLADAFRTACQLAGVDVRSWTDVWTGGGADEVWTTSSTFRGKFILDTGAGDDSAFLEWSGATTTFRGPVWVETGDGNDRILVAGDPEAPGLVTFLGASHWDGGAGAMDILLVRFTGGVFLGPDPVLTGFEVAF